MKLEALVSEMERDPDYVKAREELEPELTLAKQLLRLRLQQGLGQKDLAKKARTTQAVISRLENAAARPTLSLLKRIAAALGVPLNISLGPPPGAHQERHDYAIAMTVPSRAEQPAVSQVARAERN